MNNRSWFSKFISCSIIFLTCGAIFVLTIWFIDPTQRTEQVLGPADESLSKLDKTMLAIKLLYHQQSINQPVAETAPNQGFSIELGDDIYSITNKLEQQGLISDANIFRDYLLFRGFDRTIQAGMYDLNAGMTARDIASALQDATPDHVKLSILPGWRLEEIAQSLPTSGLEISPEEFLSVTSQKPVGYSFSSSLPEDATMEGLMPPGIYELPRNIPVDQLLHQLLSIFESRLTTELLQGFNRQMLSPFQALNIASIVEKEAINDTEMPLIASVYINRHSAGIKLEADPTVQYALGHDEYQNTWWKSPLSLIDLQIDSPYNTYLNPGLPPGPISNPSQKALRAVAFPEKSPYFYFRAACDESGNHVFAETFEEHQANACP
ncbi:MAG: endolytic transglycosylase MltG [Candidatus Thorarchaeota archaeon]